MCLNVDLTPPDKNQSSVAVAAIQSKTYYRFDLDPKAFSMNANYGYDDHDGPCTMPMWSHDEEEKLCIYLS